MKTAHINCKSEFINNKWQHTSDKLECDVKPLWWQEQGLQYTASGYGSKIPTQYVVKHNNRWKRVYCRVYSNAGTLYILQGKEQIIVSNIEE